MMRRPLRAFAPPRLRPGSVGSRRASRPSWTKPAAKRTFAGSRTFVQRTVVRGNRSAGHDSLGERIVNVDQPLLARPRLQEPVREGDHLVERFCADDGLPMKVSEAEMQADTRPRAKLREEIADGSEREVEEESWQNL